MLSTHQGSCLCGAIQFTVNGTLGPTDACHCRQCRQWTGHYFASTEVPQWTLCIQGVEHLRWYASSPKVRRGFCQHCGSSLFFDPLDRQKHHWIGIALGAFTSPTHCHLQQHIFVAEKGDYYTLTDDLPQHLY